MYRGEGPREYDGVTTDLLRLTRPCYERNLDVRIPQTDRINLKADGTTSVRWSCLMMIGKSQPLWVTHTDSNGTLTNGFLLRPDVLEALSDNKKLSFKDSFLAIHGKTPDPKFAFKEILKEPTDQLSLDFEGKDDANE